MTRQTEFKKGLRMLLVGVVVSMACATLPGCRLGFPTNDDRRNLEQLLADIRLESVPSATLPDPSTGEVVHDWHDHAEKLAALINQYDAEPRIADRLRIRLANLSLQNGEYHAAKATLDQVRHPERLSPRDQTFHALREPTLWWWVEVKSAGNAPLDGYERKAPEAIVQIERNLRGLDNVPENYRIREHYSEMAVHIANYLVRLANPANPQEWNHMQSYAVVAYKLFADTVGANAVKAAAAQTTFVSTAQHRRVAKVRAVANEIRRTIGPIAMFDMGPEYRDFEMLVRNTGSATSGWHRGEAVSAGPHGTMRTALPPPRMGP